VRKPLCIDGFCGLGGWAEGFLAEGWDVIGFDIEKHQYGPHKYPGQLVIQDVLTLHGNQFKDADCLVFSPPCQEFSYMAMPWSLAKAKAAAIRADTTGKMLADLTRLFDACFRIQAQASLAAGRRVPMVVENVRGAQLWVGRSRWNFGSYHLWGDVPGLMPVRMRGQSNKMPPEVNEAIRNSHSPARWTNAAQHYFGKIPSDGMKSVGMNWSDQTKRGQDFTRVAGRQATDAAIKGDGGSWFGDNDSAMRQGSSKSSARKAASAMIAKIPEALSRHIAAVYKPL
jgi:hypothetical protein